MGCNTTSISTNGDGAVQAAVATDCTMTSNDACLDNGEHDSTPIMTTGCNTTSISTNGHGAVQAAVATDCTMTPKSAYLDDGEHDSTRSMATGCNTTSISTLFATDYAVSLFDDLLAAGQGGVDLEGAAKTDDRFVATWWGGSTTTTIMTRATSRRAARVFFVLCVCLDCPVFIGIVRRPV